LASPGGTLIGDQMLEVGNHHDRVAHGDAKERDEANDLSLRISLAMKSITFSTSVSIVIFNRFALYLFTISPS
jgi:hypothetical protein